MARTALGAAPDPHVGQCGVRPLLGLGASRSGPHVHSARTPRMSREFSDHGGPPCNANAHTRSTPSPRVGRIRAPDSPEIAPSSPRIHRKRAESGEHQVYVPEIRPKLRRCRPELDRKSPQVWSGIGPIWDEIDRCLPSFGLMMSEFGLYPQTLRNHCLRQPTSTTPAGILGTRSNFGRAR